jgi:hypothetical protein
MSIEEGLVAQLIGDAGVSTIVGSKVHPGHVPQGEDLPAIVYTRISSEREVELDGPSNFVKVHIRVDCWHTSYSGVKSLADAVRAALNGVGIASPRTLGSEPVQLVYLNDDGDLPSFDGDRREYRVTQEWIIIHLET